MAGQWGVVIGDAGAAELPVLQEIDVATGQMFRDIGMPEVAEYDPWPLPDLEHSRAAGLLWVIPRGCACAATSRARVPDWGSPRVLPDGGFQRGQREPAVV